MAANDFNALYTAFTREIWGDDYGRDTLTDAGMKLASAAQFGVRSQDASKFAEFADRLRALAEIADKLAQH